MTPEFKLKVFAYYYPWYYGPDDTRWSTLKDYSPYLGFYKSSDEIILRQHVEWAIAYGIDGFLVQWMGDDRNDSEPSSLDANTNLLASILLDYPEFRFAIFYDQAIRFGGAKQLRFLDPDKRRVFLDDLNYAAQTYFDHPNYFRIGPRPVVAIYVTRGGDGDYPELLDQSRNEMEAFGFGRPYLIGDEVWWREANRHFNVLNAVTAYHLHHGQQLRDLNGGVREFAAHCAQLYLRVQPAATAAGAEVIPHIGHAFNDEWFRGHIPFIPTVVEGKLPEYREDVISCMKAPKEIWRNSSGFQTTGTAYLFVTSFNEWPERTAVEPSAEIETFNKLFDFRSGKYLYLQPHRFEYLEGIKEGKKNIEKRILPKLWGANE